MPMIIGAGIGALGSAVMGKSPFTGALLGGTLGGLGGAGGLFGAGGAAGTAGTTGIQLAQPAITEGFATALTPTVVGGSGAAGITGLGTQALGGAGITGLGSGTLAAGGAGITGLNTIPLNQLVNYDNISRLAVDTPLTFGEKFSNLGSDLFSYAKDNPTTALSGLNTLNNIVTPAPQTRIEPVQVPPITKGNPEAVSTPLMNVGPNVGLQRGNEIGLPNLSTRMPLTEAELLRLQQLAQQGYRG